MIKITDISKSYDGRPILKSVSLEQQAGEVISLIGPSGSGKTTLLRCVNALERADSGSVQIDDVTVDLAHAGKKDIKNLRAQTAMVFQSYDLFANLTALSNITEALIYSKGTSKKQAREIGMKLLEQVGLAEKAGAYPKELSGGQKQRIGIARAVAVNPALLLMDEPTSALDPELVGEVEKTIEDLAAQGQTMLVVTHEMALARRISTKIVFMEDGSIVEQGSPEQVFDHPQKERTRDFLSRYNAGVGALNPGVAMASTTASNSAAGE